MYRSSCGTHWPEGSNPSKGQPVAPYGTRDGEGGLSAVGRRPPWRFTDGSLVRCMPESREWATRGRYNRHTRDADDTRRSGASLWPVAPARHGAAISVRVLPRAKKNEVAGFMPDGRVKVRLTAPPVEGAANRALVELLAQVLGVRAAAIEVVAGASGRDKIVSVLGLTPELVEGAIARRRRRQGARADQTLWARRLSRQIDSLRSWLYNPSAMSKQPTPARHPRTGASG